MLFEELVEQHRVHGVIAHTVGFSFLIADHQIGIHLFYVFSHEAEPRDAIWVDLFLIMEGDWLQREDGFAGFIHWLDLVLETLRGGYRAEASGAIYNNA